MDPLDTSPVKDLKVESPVLPVLPVLSELPKLPVVLDLSELPELPVLPVLLFGSARREGDSVDGSVGDDFLFGDN